MTKMDGKKPDVRPETNVYSDQTLVEQFNRGDDSAFERIVEKYSQAVAEFVNRLLGWEGDVDDVVQDIFLSVFLGLKGFRFQSELKTWLFTITINKYRSHRYKRVLRLKDFPWKGRRASVTSAADGAAIRPEQCEQIQRVVGKLPIKYREVVVLRYLQEISLDEMSRILGVSKNVLNVRLSRARKRLRKDLAELQKE